MASRCNCVYHTMVQSNLLLLLFRYQDREQSLSLCHGLLKLKIMPPSMYGLCTTHIWYKILLYATLYMYKTHSFIQNQITKKMEFRVYGKRYMYYISRWISHMYFVLCMHRLFVRDNQSLAFHWICLEKGNVKCSWIVLLFVWFSVFLMNEQQRTRIQWALEKATVTVAVAAANKWLLICRFIRFVIWSTNKAQKKRTMERPYGEKDTRDEDFITFFLVVDIVVLFRAIQFATIYQNTIGIEIGSCDQIFLFLATNSQEKRVVRYEMFLVGKQMYQRYFLENSSQHCHSNPQFAVSTWEAGTLRCQCPFGAIMWL